MPLPSSRCRCHFEWGSTPTQSPTNQKPMRPGTAAVEFALAASLFFIFVLGIVEIGRAFMVTHLLTNAAREGCRAGVIPGTSTDRIKEVVRNQADAQGLTNVQTTVLVNGAQVEATAAGSTDKVTVQVTISTAEFTWVPGGSFLIGQLTGSYSLRRE